MRALQLVAPKTVELRIMDDPPEPGPDEVLVRMRAVGLCGSDMHIYTNGAIAGYPVNEYPIVMGHEPAGIIAEIGSSVKNLSIGTRVVVEPTITCGLCASCLEGRFNLCENSLFMGGIQLPGSLREYAVVPARNVMAIPDGMSFVDGVVVEPLAVLLHMLELAKLERGETVAVMGAGPIGLLASAVAKQSGASMVVVADRITERLDLAKQFGADEVVDYTKSSVSDVVRDVTGGKGAHVVVDAAANVKSVRNAVSSARNGARLVIIGISSQSEVSFPVWDAMSKELSFYIQKRSNQNDHEAIDMINRGLIDASALVTHCLPLERGEQAFRLLDEYADGVGKAVIEF